MRTRPLLARRLYFTLFSERGSPLLASGESVVKCLERTNERQLMVGQKRQLLLLLRQAKAVVSSLLLSYSAVEIAIKWRFYPLLLRLRNTRGLSPYSFCIGL